MSEIILFGNMSDFLIAWWILIIISIIFIAFLIRVRISNRVGNKKGLNVEIKSKENPRLEAEKHYYKADHEKLKKLGFKQTREIEIMLDDLLRYKNRIEQKKDVIVKNINWQTN